MGAKIRHYVRIRDDEACGSAHDCQRGQPVTAFHQLSRKKPYGFLVLKKIARHVSPGCFAIRWWAQIVSGEAGRLRRTVWQVSTVLLGKETARDANTTDEDKQAHL